MNIVTIKESAAFPEIGQVRKGLPKNEKGYVGKDLGTRFRILFFSGTENERSRQRFLELHQGQVDSLPNGGGLLVPNLTVMLPFPDPFECWSSSYEAYTAGRMVARADGEKFIRWVDTKTGEVKVNNGDPYTEFTPGMVVGSYKKANGKTEVIKAKAVGRLKVFQPELIRMAYFTVHTTSIYDVVHITEQLRAIEWIARFLPNRHGVAGIPLVLSRRMTDVTWVKEDGSACRVQTGLINIEADPEWVEKMLKSMSHLALPAQIGDEQKLRQALQPGEEIQLDIPVQDQEQAEEPESEFVDGEFIDENPAEVGEIPAEHPAQEPNNTQQLPTSSNGNGHTRPYDLDTLRKGLEKKAERYHTWQVTPAQRGLVAMLIEKVFACDGAVDMRHMILFALFGRESLSEISNGLIIAILNDWLKPVQDKGGEYRVDAMAAREIQAIYTESLKAEGQAEFNPSGVEADQ